ncbi:dCTP deaminase [Alphaproteobacteria bacterium]|nr:dCTP deaminase [Alphaproteobacteria bacterium]
MILTYHEILKSVTNGMIHIDPFEESMLNPNSCDYRIDYKLLEIMDLPVDPKKQTSYNEINFTDDGYILSPNKTYLANTFEEIGSDFFVPSLIGKTSLGRLGLFLQITADLGNLGAKHKWTLELKAVQPIKIYPMMRIGQVSFWKTDGDSSRQYDGKYGGFSEAKSSEIYKEFGRKNGAGI